MRQNSVRSRPEYLPLRKPILPFVNHPSRKSTCTPGKIAWNDSELCQKSPFLPIICPNLNELTPFWCVIDLKLLDSTWARFEAKSQHRRVPYFWWASLHRCCRLWFGGDERGRSCIPKQPPPCWRITLPFPGTPSCRKPTTAQHKTGLFPHEEHSYIELKPEVQSKLF